MGDWTGTVPTVLAGDVVTGDDWDNVTDELTAISAAWTTWSPTLTNLTLGNATQTAKYRRVGKTVDIFWQFVLGSTSAVGTNPRFSLPANCSADYALTTIMPLTGVMFDASSTPQGQAKLLYISASTVQINYWTGISTQASVTATAPWTWATSDDITVWGTYYTD